ncbi:MAG TPA: putative zinc-binding metallopeptidase [Verrucomicrobiales bacterium]|nr:putative zinc-binding metallopeptidase [Verrucomicrobiales bacterium]
MKLYECQCGAPLFFANTRCLVCGSMVGYEPAGDEMRPLETEGLWRLCGNGRQYGVCNWLTPADGPDLCLSCRLNHIIPDLSQEEHRRLWHRMESAKSRTVHWLLLRRLPVAPRAENERGLAFDFLMPQPDLPVLTGHDAGLITLNLEEADDSVREKNRALLHEPYRTLPGHFRHEIAHYYWWLWFGENGCRPEWLSVLREVFGDDRADYGAAMQQYYTAGAPPDWPQRTISAYASMHPWEDWAETWAHYMHITDALETAASNSLLRTGLPRDTAPLPDCVQLPEPFHQEDSRGFLRMIAAWMHLAPALNEMSLSLGHGDLYPFTPAPAVLLKLHCIHRMVEGSACKPVEEPAAESQTPESGASSGVTPLTA